MARRRSAASGVTGLGLREELAPGVFINSFYRGCPVLSILKGIILIDAPLIPEQALDWRAQIEDEYPGELFLYLINTDHHRGHALGNQYYMPVTVIAQERAHKEMSGYTENFKERVRNSFKREPEIQVQLNNIEIIPPHITFTNRATMLYGGRKIELIYVGGHTPATSLVWLPEESICFVGDILWVDQHPYMAQGNTIEWLNALEMIRQLDAEYLVPGHGPVCDAEATYRIEEYIRFMRGRVRDYYLAGKNKNETKSGLVSEMVEWFPSARTQGQDREPDQIRPEPRFPGDPARRGIAHGPNRRQRTFSKRQRRSILRRSVRSRRRRRLTRPALRQSSLPALAARPATAIATIIES